MSDPIVVSGPCAEPELPPVDAVTQGWWDATREPRLVVQRCQDCGHLQHYPRALCMQCGSLELDWQDVAGFGVVDSFSVVHRGLPGYDAPYVVARVRLDEGPILLTNLIGDDVTSWSCDQRVRVAWQPLSDGRHLPHFIAGYSS
jgi:uncharacterized OB-fold protein